MDAAKDGNHFRLEPIATGDSTEPFIYALRRVALEAGDFPQSLEAWGRFSKPLQSLAVVGGNVIGVDPVSHSMEILTLPQAGVDLDESPEARNFLNLSVLKGGLGTRAGLMNEPVAVAGFKRNVLVLENGNARVQAFNIDGTPANIFKNNGTNTVDLTLGDTYLDIAVEGKGYMYVLAYTGSSPALSQWIPVNPQGVCAPTPTPIPTPTPTPVGT